MAKLLFTPFGIVSGLIAGVIGKKVFASIWAKVDEQSPPQPQSRRTSFGKLALSLALEGALLKLVKGLVDHSSRRGFAAVTGAWPGDREAEPGEPAE